MSLCAVQVSQVISTKATGNLKCGHVIHTVGPIWVGDSGMRQCLKNLQDTFYNVLVYANSHFNIATLALPAISTGASNLLLISSLLRCSSQYKRLFVLMWGLWFDSLSEYRILFSMSPHFIMDTCIYAESEELCKC